MRVGKYCLLVPVIINVLKDDQVISLAFHGPAPPILCTRCGVPVSGMIEPPNQLSYVGHNAVKL